MKQRYRLHFSRELDESQRQSYLHLQLNFLRTCLGNRYEYRVEGRLINNRIEGSLREIHSADIHKKIFESFRFLFILIFHGLDADVGDIDVSDLSITLLKHLLAQSGVSRANIENTVSLIYMGGDDILESAKSLVPVKRLRVSRYIFVYLLYLSYQYSVLPY